MTARRVTAADIAREAGVSRATVGFVLNRTPGQTISAETQRRVHDAATALGYQPHPGARALARGKTMIVLYVLPDWPLDYSMRAHLEAASAALDAAGYTLVTWTAHSSGRTRPLWETLSPDVVIATSPFAPADIASMRRAGVSHIVPSPGSTAPAPESTSFGQGPSLQVRYLASLGHRRLGYAVTADPRLRSLLEERIELAQRTAHELELPPLVIPGAEEDFDVWRVSGVTAIAAYNDQVAAGVVRTARMRGMLVPEQLSIVGHDDDPFAALTLPSLSTVRVDNARVGEYLASVALAALRADELSPLREPTAMVVPRESTGLLERGQPSIRRKGPQTEVR